MLCTLFKHVGYFVLCGQSGEAALDIAGRHPGGANACEDLQGLVSTEDDESPDVGEWKTYRAFPKKTYLLRRLNRDEDQPVYTADTAHIAELSASMRQGGRGVGAIKSSPRSSPVDLRGEGACRNAP